MELAFEKNGQLYHVQLGVTEAQIDALIHYATTDPEVCRFSSDPVRFADRAAFDKWLAKGRTIYTLIKDGALLGVCWWGEKPIPQATYTQPIQPQDYNVTVSIRTYSAGRGKGLATPFMQTAWQDFAQTETYKNIKGNGVWLETPADNIVGIKVYTKVGFTPVSTPDDKGEIVMVLKH